MTPKMVEVHVSNAYHALGSGSRRELACAVAKHDLNLGSRHVLEVSPVREPGMDPPLRE